MPEAIAHLTGNFLAPNLNGFVEFYEWLDGTLVKVQIANLPTTNDNDDASPVGPFAFHIHEGNTCDDPNNKFEKAMNHYNPTNKKHPFHAGDLPSLLSNDGYTFMSVYTNRFKPRDVIGRTVIIHMNPDDYITQPSGNAGDRIACGIIEKNKGF